MLKTQLNDKQTVSVIIIPNTYVISRTAQTFVGETSKEINLISFPELSLT